MKTGSDRAWFHRHGAIDLFVGNESTPRSRNPCQLFHNNGDGTFTDVAAEMKIDAAMLAMGANFGYLDCYFGTGDPYLGTSPLI